MMKTLLRILLAALIPASVFGAAGDIKMSQRNTTNTAWTDRIFATGNNGLIGTSATGLESLVTTGAGVSVTAGILTLDTDLQALAALATTGLVRRTGAGTWTAGTLITVSEGGTGAASFTANSILLGNGTGAFNAIAPSTSGNLLTSNGTTWQSARAPSATVASIAALKALSVSGMSTGYGVQVMGYYANGDGGGGVFYYNSASAAAANLGMVFAPDSGSGRWIRQYSGAINARWFGCKIDGTTDDTTSLLAARDFINTEGGGELFVPAGTLRYRATFWAYKSNLTVSGVGAATKFLFDPVDGSLAGYDRAFSAHTEDATWKQSANVTGAIAKGATSLTSASAVAGTITAGDWIFVCERQAAVFNDIVLIDWVQVSSVAGNVINFVLPIRTAFSGAYSTTEWHCVGTPTSNVVFRDFYCYTVDAVNSIVGVSGGVAHNLTISGVTSAPAKGNAFYSYRTKDLKVLGCTQIQSKSQATEFAASVDVKLLGNHFGNNVDSDTSALVLDFGTAFFSVSGNTIGPGFNICVQMNYGVRDGSFIGNAVGWTKDNGIGTVSCLGAVGCNRVIVVGNTFAGAESPSYGVTFGSTSGWGTNITSSGNVVALNGYDGITTKVVIESGDTFFDVLNGGILGVDTANAPAAGTIGEYGTATRASGAALALTSGAVGNVASISLTPGDWDVEGVFYFTFGGSTVPEYLSGLFATAATDGFVANGSGVQQAFTLNNGVMASLVLPRYRVSLSTTTTIYMNAVAGFTVSTCSAFGYFTARRVR